MFRLTGYAKYCKTGTWKPESLTSKLPPSGAVGGAATWERIIRAHRTEKSCVDVVGLPDCPKDKIIARKSKYQCLGISAGRGVYTRLGGLLM